MAKKKNTVTNAMRMLSVKKIQFEVLEYTAEQIGDSFGSTIAQLLGILPEQTFKTLVGQGDKTGPIVAVIPVERELDLKKLAKCSHNKSVSLIHVKELVPLTGYARGSVSPLGMKKQFPTYIDLTAQSYEEIYVSGGACGITLKIALKDLVEVTDADVVDLTQ